MGEKGNKGSASPLRLVPISLFLVLWLVWLAGWLVG